MLRSKPAPALPSLDIDGLEPELLPLGPWQVKHELEVVDKTNNTVESFARVDFHPDCEAAINEQIK